MSNGGQRSAVSGKHEAQEPDQHPVPPTDHPPSVRDVETHHVIELDANADGLADGMIVMAGH
jgi:hypothetical protein